MLFWYTDLKPSSGLQMIGGNMDNSLSSALEANDETDDVLTGPGHNQDLDPGNGEEEGQAAKGGVKRSGKKRKREFLLVIL